MLPCSFGFRPKRPAHDALQVVIDESLGGRRRIVEPDIANCFTGQPRPGLLQWRRRPQAEQVLDGLRPNTGGEGRR